MKIYDLEDSELESISQGQAMVDAIDAQIQDINAKLRQTDDNNTWEALFDDKHELIKAKRAVMSRMGAIAHSEYIDKQLSKEQ